MNVSPPPWFDAFEICDEAGEPVQLQAVPLQQVSARQFQVDAEIRYRGETGLDPSLDSLVRTLPFDPDRLSDLASVPAALGWFEQPHGAHTPAALFHDYLLGRPDVSREQADLVFLNMLKELGVPRVKRNLMWTAVALRTRWVENRLSLVLWVVLSITGLVSFLLTLGGVDVAPWLGGRWVVLAIAVIAPLPASLLWGRTRRAALVAAVMAIWILPAMAIALLAIGVYRLVEGLVGVAGP